MRGDHGPGSAPSLRPEGRERRRSIGPAARTAAASDVADRIVASPWYAEAGVIALYRPQDGELDPERVAVAARGSGRLTCYPVVVADALRFRPWNGVEPLVPDRFDIPIPPGDPVDDLAASGLDLVIVPLVAFDHELHRVGMGGGYYDRTFAARGPIRPRLVGVGFDEQEVPHVAAESHDVRLDAVVTPTRWLGGGSGGAPTGTSGGR